MGTPCTCRARKLPARPPVASTNRVQKTAEHCELKGWTSTALHAVLDLRHGWNEEQHLRTHPRAEGRATADTHEHGCKRLWDDEREKFRRFESLTCRKHGPKQRQQPGVEWRAECKASVGLLGWIPHHPDLGRMLGPPARKRSGVLCRPVLFETVALWIHRTLRRATVHSLA